MVPKVMAGAVVHSRVSREEVRVEGASRAPRDAAAMTTQRRSQVLLEPMTYSIRDGDLADLPDQADPDPDDHQADPSGVPDAAAAPGATPGIKDGPWNMTLHPGPAVPPEMSVASVDEVLSALRGFDISGPWAAIGPSVVPVLPRRRPMPGESEPELRWTWPVGLETAFGVDLGPALVFVTAGLAGTWGVTAEQIAERALRNLADRLPGALARGVLHDATGGLPLTAFQSGDGFASALVLAPDLLAQVFGPDPALILAPMRDLLVALPIDSDPGLAAWMLDDFASLDPNGLDMPLLVFDGGTIEVYDRKKHRRRGRRRRMD